MVLCCTDYTRMVLLGNVADTTIEQVWNAEKAVTTRRLYAEGHLDRSRSAATVPPATPPAGGDTPDQHLFDQVAGGCI
jgi:hypothetical protein